MIRMEKMVYYQSDRVKKKEKALADKFSTRYCFSFSISVWNIVLQPDLGIPSWQAGGWERTSGEDMTGKLAK